ncbi:MAG TPA: arginase family protein [Candidatus Nitrosotenuis sp.]|nr:arginase family protein [Candidatus Nitrosotenuis sp.]
MKSKKENLTKKICWANTADFDSAKVVIVGIPSEVGSHAARKGSSRAPDTIRMISNRMDVYVHKKKFSVANPVGGTPVVRVFDYGNIKRDEIPTAFDKIAGSKIPITIGGDHSNTAPIIKSLGKKLGPISLVYFDAHPDMISSRGSYYGSTVFDSLPYIDAKSSALVGIRSPEQEEIENIRKHQIIVVSPFDVAQKGIDQIAQTLLGTVKDNVYISIDMDCIDPAYAPGVSVPVPLGLSSLDVAYLVKRLSQKEIVGFDIMEVCPPHDYNHVTSHLASRLVGEILCSLKI